MAVTSFDGQFSFKQDSLARLGHRERKNMSSEEQKAFQNSPFMQGVRKCEDLCLRFTSARDEVRARRDPSFLPSDEDFAAPKSHAYDRYINYYRVLGIDEYASLEEVKKAYKKLSLVYHPDKTAGLSPEQKEEYAGIFIELKNAYITLGHQATRRQYDRDRDRDKASFEINGYKPKVRAHFDATEMLKKLQEMAKPPGKVVDVPLAAKMEKFFYGGHKKITRMRRVRDLGGFSMQERVFRVDIPRGVSAPHECTYKRQGDHNENTQPDTVNFQISCKPHDLVSWRGHDVVSRSPLYLGSRSLKEPFLAAEGSGLRGRHVLLWGQNPFFGDEGVVGGNLRVRLLGEGMTRDGAWELACRFGTPPPAGAAAGGSAPSRPPRLGTGGGPQVIVVVRHMQTDAQLTLRVPCAATMADIRSRIAVVADLPRGSTVRLLQQVPGGFTPFPDRQTLNGLTTLSCAGTVWYEPALTPEKTTLMLQRLSEAFDGREFQRRLAAARAVLRRAGAGAPASAAEAKTELWAQLADAVLPDFGFPARPEALLGRLAAARAAARGSSAVARDLASLASKLADVEALGEAPAPTSASAATAAALGGSGQRRRPMKRFLLRHGLGPPGGLAGPGSETEDEEREVASAAVPATASTATGVPAGVHGRGGCCEAAALRRRAARREAASLERSCQVELAQVGEPLTLFTRPTCKVTFFSNEGQVKALGGGSPSTPPVFAILLSTAACVKKAGVKEWDQLRKSLVPVLQATGFHLSQAARAMRPRALAAAAAWLGEPAGAEAEEVDARLAEECDDLDLWVSCQRLRTDVQPLSDVEAMRAQCSTASEERTAFWRRRSAAALSRDRTLALPVPWKRMADDAFRGGDFFTAASVYTHALDELRPGGTVGDDVAAAAVVLSNRAASLAKLRFWEASLADARAALELRPRWGRAWGRVGHAAAALGRIQEAVEAFLEAVTCEPTSAHVESLGTAVARRGVNPAEAHAAKEVGNGAARTGEFGLAVAQYTYGLAMLPPDPRALNAGSAVDEHALLRCVLFGNRSAAFSRLKNWTSALADGRLAVAAKEDFAKAYTRLGTAMLGCGMVESAYAQFARALRFEAEDRAALKGRQACLAAVPLWASASARARTRNNFRTDLLRPSGSTRVYAISDLHYDHKCNEDWTHEIDNFAFQEDVLIVAGNLCDTRTAIQRALTTLKSKFRRVFYVPGNHEFWIHPSEPTKFQDSFVKFFSILELCDELGVDVFPAAVAEDVFVVPLLSWYAPDFDYDDPFPDPNSKTNQHCRWPLAETQLWRYMMRMNHARLDLPYHGCVLSFSHFLPKRSLPHPTHSGLPKTMGCEPLDEQVRAISGSQRAHVYGHSHRRHAEVDDGILYVNHFHGEDGGKSARAALTLVYDGRKVVTNVNVDTSGQRSVA